MSDPTRRHVIAGGLAAAAIGALPRPALALTEARARNLVNQVVADINRVIASGQSLSRMISEFERILGRYADVSIIARSTLGADANRISGAQMRAYTQAFRGYVARKYGRRFNEFRGGKVDVTGVRRVKSWHEVSATATLPGQSPIDVDFLVSDRSGRDKFFDMVIEGVSMRLSERAEIGAMLDARNGDIDRLTRDLRTAG